MNKELFSAILSMDSYNRGYGQSIILSGSQIGSASIIAQSNTQSTSPEFQANFYALAYNYNGQKIISYRGTDSPLGTEWADGDILTGWLVGTGSIEAKQAELAIKFYKAVAGTSNYLTANIDLTGHSLGGGLAGLVGTIYKQDVYGYDAMPFLYAAENVKDELANGNASVRNLVYGTQASWAVNTGYTTLENIIHGSYIAGEALDLVRSLISPFQPELQNENSLYSDAYLAGYGEKIPSLSTINLHSQATLVINMFGDTELGGVRDWQKSAQYFWPVLYDGVFAEKIGMNNSALAGTLLSAAQGGKKDKYSDILRTIIAYSAIDEGVMPFGSTGIRALYDDANNLGKALGAANASRELQAQGMRVSEAFVEFAGKLALNKVTTLSMTAGILTLSEVANNQTLAIDLRDSAWSMPGASSSTIHFKNNLSWLTNSDLYGRAYPDADVIFWGAKGNTLAERIVFATKESSATNLTAPSSGKVSIFVGGGGSDTVKGSSGNEQVFGANGNDVLVASTGKDILVGGDGIDTLDLRSFSGGVDFSIMHKTINGKLLGHLYTDKSNTANQGSFGGIEKFLFGNGDDKATLITTSNPVTKTPMSFDLGGGEKDEIVIDGTFIVNSAGIYWENDVITNAEIITNYSSSPAIAIIHNLGREYRGIDRYYSEYHTKLNINLVSGVVSDGSAQDIGLGFSRAAGTNYGDTVVMHNGGGFWAGRGNDDITVDKSYPGVTGTIYYTYGNDVINFNGGRMQVIMAPDITSANLSFNGTSSVNISGHGSITFNQGVASIKLWDGKTYNYDGAQQKWILGTSFAMTGNSTPYDDPYWGDNTITRQEAYGGFGNDTLYGWASNDKLYGNAGNDTLNGYAGNDKLYGDEGDDQILGGVGDDFLDGGSGLNILNGEAGNDSYMISLDSDNRITDSGYGNRLLFNFTDTGLIKNISGYAVDIYNLSGNLHVHLNDYRAFSDVAFYTPYTFDDYVSPVHKISMADFLNVSPAEFPATTVATEWSDHLNFSGSAGGVTQNLWAGNDVFIGSSYNETVYGSEGHDNIKGGDGNDQLFGSSYLTATNDDATGSDIIEGGRGADGMYGGWGDDVYVVRAGDGSDWIYEVVGQGIDTIKVTGGILPNQVSLTKKTNESWYKLKYSATDEINISNHIYMSDGSLTNSNDLTIEKISFDNGTVLNLIDILNNSIPPIVYNTTTGNDTINASAATAAVTINLLAGNDAFIGSNFNDNVTAGDGDDTVEGRGGNDTMTGGNGTDTVTYIGSTAAVTVNLATTAAQNTVGAGTDTISTFENLTGSAFNDTLTGNSGANVIDGGAGNDTIQGGAGNDVLIGGAGTDRVTFAASTAAVTVNLATTAAQNTVGAGTDTISGFENLTGSNYNDTLTGDAGANSIDGGSGNDIIQGGAGNDTLIGGAGTDTVTYASATAGVTVNLGTTAAQNTVGAGTDTISTFENLTGSSYNDTLTGSSGNNTIKGGTGNDIIQGGAGNDILNGEAGTDTVTYAAATAAVTVNLATTTSQATGGAGSDTITNFENLTGSSYSDTLRGNTGNNTLTGGNGNDKLYGNSGNDILYGDAGTDTLYGDAGNDTLNGGASNDILYGGTGSDIFKFSPGGGIDTVKDFKKTEVDKLDIKDLLTGYDPATKAITDFIQITTSGTSSIVKIDANGLTGGTAWTQIATLQNITGLTDEAALKAAGTIIA